MSKAFHVDLDRESLVCGPLGKLVGHLYSDGHAVRLPLFSTYGDVRLGEAGEGMPRTFAS